MHLMPGAAARQRRSSPATVRAACRPTSCRWPCWRLSNNVVVWVDEAMVRRELGADRADLPGLGYAPRALRLAHLVQHQVHLADLLLASGGRGFAAHENFPLLPSAGPIPAGMIDSGDFTQRYFPPEMAVDFSIIPEDELPALVEEALSLPPIDLEAPSATLESTSILLLAPIPRNEWRAVSSRLTTRTRTLRPAAINLVATRKPLEILQQLRIPRLPLPIDSSDPSNAEWARLAVLPDLWFVRRRNLAYRDDLAGEAIRLAGRDTLEPSTDSSRLSALGLDIASNRVFARATPRAALEVQSLLASPRFAESPSLTAAALGELGRAETLDQAAVLRVAADLSAPGVGDGLIRLERARPDSVASTAALAAIADGGDWRSADSAAAKLRSAELSRMAGTVLRPQPLNPAEPAVKPTLTTPTAAPTPTLIPRSPTRARGRRRLGQQRKPRRPSTLPQPAKKPPPRHRANAARGRPPQVRARPPARPGATAND
jgi:hypothetical protein